MELQRKFFLKINDCPRWITTGKACLLLGIFMTIFICNGQAQTQRGITGSTAALFQSIRSGNAQALEKQLNAGASANDSLEGYSALMCAALNGSAEQMKLLIDHGAAVNFQARDGVTALWLSIPDWEKTNLLLDHGADVNHTITGYTVLVKLAAIPGNIKLFRLLVDRGADLKKSAPDNYLVYNAAASGDTAILGFLIRAGFSVNDSVAMGDYPINNAELYRTFATLKMLVDNGANVNVRQWIADGLDAFKGCTPLMFAAVGHDKPSLLYLLDHGADPNAKNKQGYTSLMLLAQSETDDPEMTLAMIQHGADVSAKAQDGTNALYYARFKGKTASVAILEKYSYK